MRYLSDCAPRSLLKSPYLGAEKDVNQHTSVCVKENEQVVNKKLPLQVQNSVTCVVSAPISLFPPPQNIGATGNWALRKICSFHLQPEITSKAMKIHGKKHVNICLRHKRLRESLTFQPGISFWSASSAAFGPDKMPSTWQHTPLFANPVSLLPSISALRWPHGARS